MITVGELEHLREAARLLRACHDLGFVRSKAYGAALDSWLKADYVARKAAAEPGKAGGFFTCDRCHARGAGNPYVVHVPVNESASLYETKLCLDCAVKKNTR